MKLLVVDSSPSSPTSKIVEAAADIYRRKNTALHLECEVVPPSDAMNRVAAHSGTRIHDDGVRKRAVILLVPLSEPLLSRRLLNDSRKRVACDSLSLAHALVRNALGQRVYLLRTDAPPLSGIDVVAALLSGVAGVLDDRLLLYEGVMKTLAEHNASDGRWRSVSVIGRSAPGIQELKNMLVSWDEGALGGDGTLDPACWRTAMALAQLDQLRPIQGTGDRYSFVKLAQALNLRKEETSFQLSQGDLRRTLSMLSSHWRLSDAEPAERIHLPRHARAHGFPAHQPAINGFDDCELPKRIYDTSRSMQIVPQQPIDGEVPHLFARLLARDIKRLRGNN